MNELLEGRPCRFRDCHKEACLGSYFCSFHLLDTERHDAHQTLGAIRAVERALKHEPEHNDSRRYGLAVARVLTKWFGDEAKLVAAECLRILEAR